MRASLRRSGNVQHGGSRIKILTRVLLAVPSMAPCLAARDQAAPATEEMAPEQFVGTLHQARGPVVLGKAAVHRYSFDSLQDHGKSAWGAVTVGRDAG